MNAIELFILGLAIVAFAAVILMGSYIYFLEKRMPKPENRIINYSIAGTPGKATESALTQDMVYSIEAKGYEVSICRIWNSTTKQNERQVQVLDKNGKIIFFRPVLNGKVVGALKVAKDYIDNRRPNE